MNSGLGGSSLGRLRFGAAQVWGGAGLGRRSASALRSEGRRLAICWGFTRRGNTRCCTRFWVAQRFTALCTCFWVAQRFTAAIKDPFSMTASADEGTVAYCMTFSAVCLAPEVRAIHLKLVAHPNRRSNWIWVWGGAVLQHCGQRLLFVGL